MLSTYFLKLLLVNVPAVSMFVFLVRLHEVALNSLAVPAAGDLPQLNT